MNLKNKYKAIVIGTSAGGLNALTKILSNLPSDFPFPLAIVQHRAKDQKNLLEEVLQSKCKIKIKQADEKETIEKGIAYVAPPDYHLLIEADETFSLSVDEPWLNSRPSIDILFESAAIVFKEKLIAILLTGANSDGSQGIVAVNNFGGLTIAQEPSEADYPHMPKAAIDTKKVKFIWTTGQIKEFLIKKLYS